MHHKGRQSKPNSPLLLPSGCSSFGFSARNQDQVGFVCVYVCFSSAVILIDSLPHLLRKGQRGFALRQDGKLCVVMIASCCLIASSIQKSWFA